MIQELKNQWGAPETPWGTKLKIWGGYVLIGIDALAELNEYLNLFPAISVPHWVHEVIFVAGIINFLIGKFTKRNEAATIDKIQNGQI